MQSLDISTAFGHYPISRLSLVRAVAYICILVGVQRFYLGSIYSLICVVPFILAFILPAGGKALQNSLLVLSLYLSVDQGAGVYAETPSVIRYVIYLSILGLLLSRLRLSLKMSAFYFLGVAAWITITISNYGYIQFQSLYRDALVAFLFGVVLLSTRETHKLSRLDFEFLKNCMLIALGMEFFQIATVFEYNLHGYLSYDSGKFLITLPAVFYLIAGKPVKAILTMALISIALLLYGTRLIPIAFFVGIFIHVMAKAISGRKSELIILLAISLAGALVAYNYLSFERFKLIGTLVRASTAGTLTNFLDLLDPVRFGELTLLFDRSLFDVVFGSGFGVGIRDDAGTLSFVSIYQTAFSETEIRSGVFYGFHDVWTDIGVRFGLIFVAIIYCFLFKNILNGNRSIGLSSIILFIAITCAFFTTAGLLVCTMLALDLRWRQSEADSIGSKV